jgi:primase-polymerase (primpol)-like protein
VTDTMKPITQQGDLAKLPRALAPLIERPQWCIWRWELTEKGRWQKPPLKASDPQRHASTTDPSTWTMYNTALAAVQAGHGDGISYILILTIVAVRRPIRLIHGRRTGSIPAAIPIPR